MGQPALKIRYPLSNPTPIETVITRGLPLRTADEADQEIVRLTVALMKLQAELDAMKMKEEL
jgi:hypothetical protein